MNGDTDDLALADVRDVLIVVALVLIVFIPFSIASCSEKGYIFKVDGVQHEVVIGGTR